MTGVQTCALPISLRDALKTWCGDYYLPTYIKVVTQHCDVGADDVLSTDLLRDPQRAIPLAKAMALQEAGQAFPLDDHAWLQAHEMAFSPTTEAPGWTPKNDVPTRNPEDKRDDMLRAVGLGAVATGGTTAAAAPVAAPYVPAIPAAVEATMANVTAWAKLATGFIWAEGPVWFSELNELRFSDIPNNRIMRWSPVTGLSTFRQPSLDLRPV